MEYVNECDECQEQQNCKHDANDNPCGYGLRSSVLDDSNLNVLRHYGPANNLCALGKLCVHCFNFGVVCNTVYNPSGSVLSSSDECINLCKECSLIHSANVTVGQFECAVSGALNCVKNHFCTCGLESGQVSCVENGTCGNGNSNIIVGYSYGSVFNGDNNVGCRHCELTVNYCNFIANGCAIGGFINLDDCGVTGLVSCGNIDFGSCGSICLISGCIAVGVYVVVAVVSNTVEVNFTAACNEHSESEVGQSHVTVEGVVGPNVAGFNTVDGRFEVCKSAISPNSNGVFVRFYEFSTNIEVYGNLGYSIIYPEEGDVLAELSENSVFAEPFPTGLVCITIGNIAQNGLNKCFFIVSIVFYCVLESLIGLELTVYIVVNIVNRCLCIVLSGNRLTGHCEGKVTICIGSCCELIGVGCANKQCLEVFVTEDSSVDVQLCGNGFALCVPTFICNTFDVCNTVGSGSIGFEVRLGIIDETILVNESNSGEVRSVECNHSVFNGNACNCISINVNKGLFVVAGLACERKNELNTVAKAIDCIYAIKSCLDGFFAVGIVFTIELISEGYGITGCCINEGCKHCIGDSYLLCACFCSGKNEILALSLNLGQECLRKFEAQSVCIIIPVLFNDYYVIVAFNLNVYKAVNLNLGLFGNFGFVGFFVFLCCNICNNIDVAVNGDFAIKCYVNPFNAVGITGFLGVLLLENLVSSGFPNSFIECNNCACLNTFNHRNGYFKALAVLYDQVNIVVLNFGVCNLGGGFGGGFVFNVFNSRLYNDVLGGHLVNDITGCNIYPTFRTFEVGVIQHLGKVGSYRKESIENNNTVVILKGYTVEIGYLNGYIKAGGHVSGFFENHIQCDLEHFVELFFASSYCRYARSNNVNCLSECLLHKCSCIKGNALCKYKGCIACIEVHEAVVSNNGTNSGVQETVNNADSIALYKVVNAACVLCLINNSVVEVCEGIGGSSCCLEQIFHIKVVTNNLCELVDNVVNGVVKITVNLCGQMVGDFNTGNAFKFFYEYIKGGNGCEGVNEILYFELVGNVLAGNSFNIGDENLGIARGKRLVVCLAEECRINCLENSNDLFKSQFLCECNKVIGLSLVSCKNLILDDIHFGAGGICQRFESDAENACEFSGNSNISYQLAICKIDVANLAEQNGEFCCCCTDHVGACSKNKVEVDFLGLFNLTLEVGDCEACGKQLAAVIDVCELGKGGNKIFESVDQSCGLKLQESFSVLSSNSSTINLNFGDGLLHSCKDIECLNHVGLEIQHAIKLLCYVNTGSINNLNKLLNVNLAYKCTNVDSLNQAFCIDHLGDNAITDNTLSNSLNIKCGDELLKIGDVLKVENSLIAANCINNRINTNSIDCCGVTIKACNDICGNDETVVESSGNLILNNVNLNKVSIAVVNCKCIYTDNVVCNQFLNSDNTVIEQALSICYFVAKVCTENFYSETLSVIANESFQSILIDVFVRQISIADNSLDVAKVCSSLNVNAFELYSLVDVNDLEELLGSEIQSEIHQRCGVILNESLGIDVFDCLIDIFFIDVVHQNIDVLNVGLQIHILEQADETFGIYASEQLVSVNASEKCFGVNITDDILGKIDNLFFGKNCQNFCLSQNVAKTAIYGQTFNQSLDVAVLNVGQESLRVNGNSNVGRRYVFNLLFVGFYVQPVFSQRTERQNCQNSDDS